MNNFDNKIISLLLDSEKQSNDIKLLKEFFQTEFKKKINFFDDLNEQEQKQVWNFCIEYCKSDYPLQYLVGFEYFGNNKILVNPGVLIPRMETEELVHHLVTDIRKKYQKDSKINILDMCTGSGAIIIEIYFKLKNEYKLNFTAVDISSDALKVAKKNFENYQIYVEIIQSNMFEKLNKNIKYDFLISNPPYISYEDSIQDNVRKYEPDIALFTEDNGLYLIKIIIDNLKKYLKKQGKAFLEIGNLQYENVYNYVNFHNKDINVDIMLDMNDKERVVMLEMD